MDYLGHRFNSALVSSHLNGFSRMKSLGGMSPGKAALRQGK